MELDHTRERPPWEQWLFGRARLAGAELDYTDRVDVLRIVLRHLFPDAARGRPARGGARFARAFPARRRQEESPR